MKILIASINPTKIEGARKAFESYFSDIQIQGIEVPSGVPEQPFNDEIYVGALNRVQNLMNYAVIHHLEADYFISIESGVINTFGQWSVLSVAVIKNKAGQESWGASPAYPLPKRYIPAIKESNLSVIMEKLFSHQESQKNGGINYLTHGQITRTDLCKTAFIMALTSFIIHDIWIL